MKNKTIATMALLALTALSCFLLTTCNSPITDDTDNLPLDEWVVSRVEYDPTYRTPYVDVFFSNGLNGNGYRKEDATENWMAELVSIPGLELGGCVLGTSRIRWTVKNQTAAAGDPLTAYFSQEEFIECDGEVWDQEDIARVRIKTVSMPVTIIE